MIEDVVLLLLVGVKMKTLLVNQPRRKLELDYNFVSPEPDLDFASDIILPSVTFESKLFSAGATHTSTPLNNLTSYFPQPQNI